MTIIIKNPLSPSASGTSTPVTPFKYVIPSASATFNLTHNKNSDVSSVYLILSDNTSNIIDSWVQVDLNNITINFNQAIDNSTIVITF